jgi:hypothetical protein
VIHKSPRLLPALWRPGMTRQPRPSRVYRAPSSSGRLAVTAPRAWPPHNCRHSPWRSTHVDPAGQVSCTAGCGWGFEADLIPAHSPMMSRTRTIPPIPIRRFTGFLGRLRRSLRQALREQVNEAPDHEQDAEQDRNQHDRGRKPFHVPNVTPSTADWGMPILLALVLVAIQRFTHYERVLVRWSRVQTPRQLHVHRLRLVVPVGS